MNQEQFDLIFEEAKASARTSLRESLLSYKENNQPLTEIVANTPIITAEYTEKLLYEILSKLIINS